MSETQRKGREPVYDTGAVNRVIAFYCHTTESHQPQVKQKATNAVDQLLKVLPFVIAE